jgi:spore germination protein KC
MINFKKLVVILCLAVISSGCWSSREFDTLTLIKAVGIDLAKKEDRVNLTVQATKPEKQEGGGFSAASVFNSTGYTLFEANRNLIKPTGRKPFYSHAEVIIIGEKLARQGIKPYIDFLNRDPEIRRRAYIVIAKDEPEKILKASHGLETISGLAIKQIINGQSISGVIFSSDLREFTISLLSDTQDPVTAPVELKKGGPQAKEEKGLIYVEGGAMFKNDKLVSYLTRRETRGLNWVVKSSEVVGPILIKAPRENKRIAIEVLRAKSSLKPELEDGKLKMKIRIEAEGNIAETLVRKYNITTESSIAQLNKRFAQVVRNEIKNTLKKSREYQADIFGLGEAVKRKYPQSFKKKQDEWDHLYTTLPVEIEVKADIRRLGMVKEGVGTYK